MKKILSLILLLSFTIKAQDVKIGTQTWTTKNLDVSKFRNGEAIPLAITNAEWELAGQNQQPTWCYYENKGENGTTYGKLYNWYAVNDARGLAPSGYHIPTDAEWTILTDYLGEKKIAGTKMKSTTGWPEEGKGTNTSGLAGLPGAYRSFNGNFDGIGNLGLWWSSSKDNTIAAWVRLLNGATGDVTRISSVEQNGFSVRCLKD